MPQSPWIWFGDDAKLLPHGTILDWQGSPLIPTAPNGFGIIQPTTGSSPTATVPDDVLTFTCGTGISVAGNSFNNSLVLSFTGANYFGTIGTQAGTLSPNALGQSLFFTSSNSSVNISTNFTDSIDFTVTPACTANAYGGINTPGGNITANSPGDSVCFISGDSSIIISAATGIVDFRAASGSPNAGITTPGGSTGNLWNGNQLTFTTTFGITISASGSSVNFSVP